MKVAGKVILAIGLILPLMVGGLSVRAATEPEIENAIQKGLEWLAGQQAPDGHWGEYGYSAEGATGLAVLKFEERARDLGLDPFDPAYEYSAQVQAGLDYLFSATETADGFVWISGTSGYDNYNTGIGMMALAASSNPGRIVAAPGPVMGWTYEAVLQGMLDYMADAQNDGTPMCECDEGGWGYVANQACASDQSNTGYSTLGIGYAISPVYDFALTVDPGVLAKLEIFMANVQRPDGGSDYNPCYPWDESNMLRTGNLLYEMALVTRPVVDPTVQAAIGYIENNWPAAMDDPQHRFTVMKGLEAYNIQTLSVGGSDIDWFDEMSTYIVESQNPDGSWPPWWGPHLDAAWNLLTLERVVPPYEVEIDIKPWSYPNSINLKNKGLIPVAILTTEFFDAATVDPETVVFAGASPVHSALEDVEGDGDLDLILHFRTQETDIAPGDTEACLTGETYDGSAIVGCDSVRTVPEA